MEYKEDVRTFLKRDLGVFAVRSGQHKADLVKVPVDRFKGIKINKRIEYAKNITICIIKAIKTCSEKSRKILIGVYIFDKPNRLVMRDVGYKQSRYYDLKHIAIDEFMENFVKDQKEMNLNPSFKLTK
ncbi:hypothetical protein [uncultured Lactobacillus sp.]|uniref:hypothetical protein n=1 Tax=uncultured Lactobacillus sp. TaxID=153152 RepID=UPI0025F653AA|nr:hypothetical protein [uncultured Lactobacillus sp.]